MDDLPEEPTRSQSLELSIKHQEPDAGLSGDNNISTSLPRNPDIGMFEVARMKSLRDSMSVMTGMDAIGGMSDLTKSLRDSMSAMTGMDAIGGMSDLTKSLRDSMSAMTGMDAIGGMSDLTKSLRDSMSVMTGMDAIGGMSDLTKSLRDSMSAMTGMDAIGGMSDLTKSLRDSMSAMTGMDAIGGMSDLTKSLRDSMSAMTGMDAIGGMSDWQKRMQESMSAIVGIGSLGGISELQKLMDSVPYRGVLDLNAKTWLDYARSVPDFSALSYPHLDALTAALDNYDSRIALQVEAFPRVPYLKAHQKHALIAHESRQRSVRLGPADIEYADTIALGIDATQALVDQIAGVSDDQEHLESISIEAEVFDVLAKEGEEYPVPLMGAIQSASSDNPDKARQTMASLRELTMHVLHRLSPDSEVKKWSSKPEHYHNGRPTRVCRIEFIFRDCVGSSIRPYIENEVKFTKDFFDFLNGGTHSINAKLDENDLRYAIYKTESLVLLLLKYARR